MNEEAAFLRAICEHPDDDTPRLVFADWLTEQGGPVNTAWAVGIRAQVALARGADDDALRFQTCVFDSRFGQEKLRERLALTWPDQSTGVTGWDRGFPARVSGVFHELCDLWPEWSFRLPIRSLDVHEMADEDPDDLTRWPALTALRELSCTGVWQAPPVEMIRALARCADLRNLKSLTLHNVRITDDIVSALLDSSHLAGLETLRIGYEGSLNALSDAVRNRLVARFGPDVYDDSIPF